MNTTPQKYQIDGNHYVKHSIQPWDIISEYGLNFWEGNALKYLLRRKSGVARVIDLQKAKHYIEELIRQEEVKKLQKLNCKVSLLIFLNRFRQQFK